MKASSLGVGNMAIGRTSGRQSSASATSAAYATLPSSRSRTAPLSGIAGASRAASAERGRTASRSLSLRLFSLIALLSALPVVLCGYLESSERRARDQIWFGLRDRAAAIPHTFSTGQLLNDRPRTAGRSAQLAGLSGAASRTTARPTPPAPAP